MKNQVRSLTSRRYVEEAIAAYGASAYRAALISIWIAVAADIITKIRLLADQREAEAMQLRDLLDAAIASNNVNALQSFERSLVDSAHKKLELIGAREAVELGRLYTDRHLCAHPAFVAGGEELFDPSPELVRSHLTTAVDALLSHPATTGRKAIERFGREINSDSFPGDDQRLNDHLRASYMDHGTRALKANLIKVVCKESLKTEVAWPLRRRSMRTARELQKIAPNLFEEQLRAVLDPAQNALDDDGLMALVDGLCRVPGAWQVLHAGTQARVEELLRKAKPATLVQEYVLFYGPLPLAPVDRMLLDRLPDICEPGALKDVKGPVGFYMSEKPDGRLFPALLELAENAMSYEAGAAVLSLVNAIAHSISEENLTQLLHVCSKNPQISGSVLGNRQLNSLRWRDDLQGPVAKAAWAEWDGGAREDG